MFQRVTAIAGWLALAFIVFATLSPINNRPVVAGPQLARRIFLVGAVILVSAFGLEALQLLTPDRHARLLDALVKAAGGVFGIGAGQIAQLVLRTQIKGVG